jgi:hypothetical protein
MDNNEILKLLQLQNKAVQIIKSIQSSCDLNQRQTNIRTMKVSENILSQIDSTLKEIEALKNTTK